MSVTDCILSGTLSLGHEVEWQGQNVFTDFCLYTDESSESSQILDVDFQLEAIVDYAAIKLFLFKRHRWKAGIMESTSPMHSFLSGLFDQGTNISGTTKRALIISVIKGKYPSIGSKFIVYGEKTDTLLYTYVHPIYNDHDFLPIYEASTFYPHNDTIDQPILDELFGEGYEFDFQANLSLMSSAQLPQPTNTKSELELIQELNQNELDRDLISEFKNAAEERKKSIKEKKKQQLIQQQQPIRISKSKPNKYTSSKSTLEEKKNVVKRLIKEALSGTAKEDKSINQLIYSSIRYTYRHVLTSSKSLDESKLQCIIKLHTDFYNNLENIVNIFHPNQEDNN